MTSSFLSGATLASVSGTLAAAAVYAYTQSPEAATTAGGLASLGVAYYLSPTAKKANDIAVLVVCQKDWDGLGDCHHALNVSQFLATNFPDYQVTLLSNSDQEQNAFRKMGMEVSLASDYKSTKPSTLVIQLPVLQKKLPDSIVEKSATLFIGEYSFTGMKSEQARAGNFKSSGCGKGELGVFVEEPVAFDKGQQRSSNQSFERLAELVKIHLPPTDISKDLIYFGYTGCWYGVQRFLAVVSRINYVEGNREDITVFIPGSRLLGQEASGRLMGTLAKSAFLSFLRECGVDTLVVYLNKREIIIQTGKETSKEGSHARKALRLVLPGLISQEDVSSFHLHTQPITMVTGDGSFTKALTLGIPTLLECPSHKRKSHANISKIGPERSKELLRVGHFLKGDSHDYREYSQRVAELVKGRVPALHEDFKAMARELKQHHNYETKLTALVERWVKTDDLS